MRSVAPRPSPFAPFDIREKNYEEVNAYAWGKQIYPEMSEIGKSFLDSQRLDEMTRNREEKLLGKIHAFMNPELSYPITSGSLPAFCSSSSLLKMRIL